MKLLIPLVAMLPAFAQNGTPVRVSDSPTPDAFQRIFTITGSNTTAICYAPSVEGSRAGRQVAISAISKANPAVITSTSHGFNLNSSPQVVISGATGTGWSAVNGTFTATIIDANTFSIPVNSTSFGTLGGTVIFTTTAPRTNIAEWAVSKLAYDGSNNLIWSGWIGGVSTFSQKCSDVSSSTVVVQ